MKLAIIGSRGLRDFDKKAILSHIPPGVTGIVSGGASGVDALAGEIARELGLPLEEILPDYGKYGKSAPVMRNEQIVKRSGQVLAVWDFRSRGTADVIAKCIRMGVPVRVIGPEGREGDSKFIQK